MSLNLLTNNITIFYISSELKGCLFNYGLVFEGKKERERVGNFPML